MGSEIIPICQETQAEEAAVEEKKEILKKYQNKIITLKVN